MQNILVTGATGFVGSHALEALNAMEGVRVIAACRDRSRLIPAFRGEVREGDLRDPDYLDRLLDGVDVVCHAAAWSSIWGHARQSRELFLRPSLALVEAAMRAGVKRFVNVSTTSAAAPDHAADAMSRGTSRTLWPHLCNVVAVENLLRDRAAARMGVVNMRLGIYVGRRYALGVLPILLPRLKTHLVPWMAGGRTGLPLLDGRDAGQALALACTVPGLSGYQCFNAVGPEVPTVRRVIDYLHDEFGYPRPHFSVPFPAAYAFGWLMEKLDPIVPWEPLVTRSIVHLLEDTGADNARAEALLGYRPRHGWREAIRLQLEEMAVRQTRPMPMARPSG